MLETPLFPGRNIFLWALKWSRVNGGRNTVEQCIRDYIPYKRSNGKVLLGPLHQTCQIMESSALLSRSILNVASVEAYIALT